MAWQEMAAIEKFIPSGDEIQRRATPGAQKSPSAASVARIASYLESSGYHNANLEVYNAILEFGAGEIDQINTRGMFLRGPSGIGKTFGIQCLAKLFQWPVIPATTFVDIFMEAPTSDFESVALGLDFFGRGKVIVIDDLGTEALPVIKFGTAYNVLADVIDLRYRISYLRHGIKTLVTSNLTDEELRSRYGFRIDDRINELFTVYNSSGRSLR